METASAAAQCRLLCCIHNIPREHCEPESWIRTVLDDQFQVDHCQRIEGKSTTVLCTDCGVARCTTYRTKNSVGWATMLLTLISNSNCQMYSIKLLQPVVRTALGDNYQGDDTQPKINFFCG